MEGKVAAVFGVANRRSITYGIAKALRESGATLALGYQNERIGKSLGRIAGNLGDPWCRECDVADEAAVQTFFAAVQEELGGLDYLVHSVAAADQEELAGKFLDSTMEGWSLAVEVSAYSLVRLARGAVPLMEGRDGSIVALTYLGSEKVVPRYNVMGVTKAALESTVRYLASELGPAGIRVNAVSSGPIRTLSSSAFDDFTTMLEWAAERAPLRRNVTIDDVGRAVRFLLSGQSSGITGQVLFVDAGYRIMGM